MIPSLTSGPKTSLKFEKNSWADYIELLCLKSIDKEYSLSDVLAVISEEEYEGPEHGSDATGEQEDALHRKLLDIFRYLKNRAFILDNAYPFSFIDDDTFAIDLDNLTSEQLLYLFLLYSSNLSFFSRSEQQRLTKAFEAISKHVLSRIYPSHHVEIFGTASSPGDVFYGGKLIERFERLAEKLNTELKDATKRNPHYNQPIGDGGLDLVGFIQLDDLKSKVPFIPLCFAQCACSLEKWSEKQSSIKFDEWNQRFEALTHYCEFIFVPFSLRGPDGKWSYEEADKITVIPIDRIRFIHMMRTSEEAIRQFEQSDAYLVAQESVGELN